MAPKLIAYADWIKHTDALGFKRSAELQRLDAALKAHERALTNATLQAVQQQFEAWKKAQGPGWKTSRRNKGGYIDLLATLLAKGEDSDAAWGTVPDFMHESLVHARLGVLYLFGHLNANPRIFNVILEGGLSMAGSMVSYAGADVKGGGLGNSAASNASLSLPSAMVPGNEIINAGWGATKPLFGRPDAMARVQGFIQSVERWFRDFAARLLEELKQKWRCELPAAVVKAVVNAACGATLSACASGLLSGALDTTKGVIVTADAVLTKIRAWRTSREVEFASGHPTMVVNTIHRAMSASIGEGLWTLLQGVANLGLTAATAGTAMLVGVIVAGAEMLAKVFWRLYEVTQMNRFFAEAAEHWRNRSAADALHRQPFAFARWYRKHVLLAPALAVLTLNSGICGDKMVYLSMFRDDQAPIGSAEFRRGTEHLDALKVWGTKYLADCGFSFSSANGMVGRLVQFAQGGGTSVVTAHQANLSGGAKVWDYVVRAAMA